MGYSRHVSLCEWQLRACLFSLGLPCRFYRSMPSTQKPHTFVVSSYCYGKRRPSVEKRGMDGHAQRERKKSERMRRRKKKQKSKKRKEKYVISEEGCSEPRASTVQARQWMGPCLLSVCLDTGPAQTLFDGSPAPLVLIPGSRKRHPWKWQLGSDESGQWQDSQETEGMSNIRLTIPTSISPYSTFLVFALVLLLCSFLSSKKALLVA